MTIWLRRAASSRPLVYAVFSILYLIPTLWLSRKKMFWDDEFFTLYLSRTSGWHSLMQALATGADQHPPPFYYLTHWITQVFGMSHVTLRLPAIIGFGVFCICLYEIIRSVVTPMWGVVAMLFPLSTKSYYYASEARGYGMVTAFVALAFLAWLKVTEDDRRKIFLPLLGISLMGAVSSHYYAGLAVISLAAGEIIRSMVRRKIDFPVWIAFGCTLLPILVFLPTIRSARGYSAHFWAIPVWSDAILFYPSELGLGIFPLLGLLVAGISCGVSLTGWKSPTGDDPERPEPITSWQMAAFYCLSITPIFAMIAAKLATHGFTSRYAISAVVGVSILVVYFISRLSPRSLTAFAAALVCLLMFGLQIRFLNAKNIKDYESVMFNLGSLGDTGDQQIALMDLTLLHQLTFYAPRKLATRVDLVVDPEESIRYLHQDTVDRGLMDLRPWFPMKVVPVQLFLADNPRFLVYGEQNDWTWLTYDLPAIGEAKLLARQDYIRLLFEVDPVHFPLDQRVIAQQRADAANMLYLQEPQTGPSLCDLWMGPQHCILQMH
jgi:hypothetical protein